MDEFIVAVTRTTFVAVGFVLFGTDPVTVIYFVLLSTLAMEISNVPFPSAVSFSPEYPAS